MQSGNLSLLIVAFKPHTFKAIINTGKYKSNILGVLLSPFISFCFLWINCVFFKRVYLFIFGEKGREGEREGEKHQCVVASHAPCAGDVARNPGMCPEWELNR